MDIALAQGRLRVLLHGMKWIAYTDEDEPVLTSSWILYRYS